MSTRGQDFSNSCLTTAAVFFCLSLIFSVLFTDQTALLPSSSFKFFIFARFVANRRWGLNPECGCFHDLCICFVQPRVLFTCARADLDLLMMSRPKRQPHVRGSSGFQPRGDSAVIGLRSSDSAKCASGKLVGPASRFDSTAGRLSTLKYGPVSCHHDSPHPLDDDLRARCAGVRFPLTFASAHQH